MRIITVRVFQSLPHREPRANTGEAANCRRKQLLHASDSMIWSRAQQSSRKTNSHGTDHPNNTESGIGVSSMTVRPHPFAERTRAAPKRAHGVNLLLRTKSKSVSCRISKAATCAHGTLALETRQHQAAPAKRQLYKGKSVR